MKKIIGILVCLVLVIAMLPAIGANSTERIEECSKNNEFHIISMTATCDMFAFDTFSLHFLWLWLNGPYQSIAFFVLDNVTLMVDGEIVDVDTPLTIEFRSFKGWAVSPFMSWLYDKLIEEQYTFDVHVYGICKSINFVPPIYP